MPRYLFKSYYGYVCESVFWMNDAVKVLHSICLQVWKTQQWHQEFKRSVFIPIPISHVSKVMLKILQARLQKCVNRKLLDVQAEFRKGRRTRDQIDSIHWIIEKAREFQKNICFIDYTKTFDCVDHNKMWKILKRDGNTRPPYLPPVKSVCRSRSNR